MVDNLSILKEAIALAFKDVFEHDIVSTDVSLSETKKEFNGQYTLVVFPFTKVLRKKPEDIAEALGAAMMEQESPAIESYNVIKGFLNFELPHNYWKELLNHLATQENLGVQKGDGQKVMVEFSSPNTNKPLHLGHIRNILLGWSTSRILESVGHPVIKTQIINDRGIAICKSMLAWKLFGNGQTPQNSDTKGDHLVGQYYRRFDQELASEYQDWQSSDDGMAVYNSRDIQELTKEIFFKKYKNDYFNSHSVLGRQAKDMLVQWESNDTETRALWKQMNGWVYDGFNATYEALDVTFDTLYFESETYLLGKDLIQQGLESGAFYRQADSSVWVDLEDRGLDKKILLRSDGTSVYMTQDLGTAQVRYNDLGSERMIYVVGDEQDYHFQVLFEILKKLEEPYANGLYHLSYGMVDLPTGRMKSREGTVVDADDLIQEVINEVKNSAVERGELEDLSDADRAEIYRRIGLGALKFFMLKVGPKKRMLFDPKESVDMQGQTGPYIQNAYVRIQSILRKLEGDIGESTAYSTLDNSEIDLLQILSTYPDQVSKAAQQYDPSIIASYAYDLAKRYHKFYHDVRILSAESDAARNFRLHLCDQVAKVLEHSMDLLGIEMPERM